MTVLPDAKVFTTMNKREIIKLAKNLMENELMSRGNFRKFKALLTDTRHLSCWRTFNEFAEKLSTELEPEIEKIRDQLHATFKFRFLMSCNIANIL